MYIIRGTYKKGNVYFVDSYINNDSRVNIYSLTLEGAKRITDRQTAIEICINMNDDSFKVFNICPNCHKEYSEPPAISRRDNKTYICSNCGTREALYDFINKRA
ncbi:MAG: hypothetical protein Q4E75_04620 [bacterium]|nr:hypothetical protein [bacterium]